MLIKDLPEVGIFSNLLICQPILLDLEAKTQMEDLAVVLQIESVVPVLSMNAKVLPQ